MRKFLYVKTMMTFVILVGLSFSANAEMIGTGKPSANAAATSSASCDWWNDGVFTCLAAWWE